MHDIKVMKSLKPTYNKASYFQDLVITKAHCAF